MAKHEASSALNLMLKGMKAGGKTVTMSDLDKRAITNAADSMYDAGTILEFPGAEEVNDRIGIIEFTANGRTSEAPCICVDSNRGPKKVFLSQLTRTIMPYVEKEGDFVQEGDPVHGAGKLYDLLVQQRTAGDIVKCLLDKKVKVVEVKNVRTARYAGGSIVGLRNAQLPVFEFEE